MTKLCPNCKTANEDSASFCQNCGNKLKTTASDRNQTKPQNQKGLGGWWNKQSTGGKAAMGIAGICCIGLILIIAISGMYSPDKTTTTNPTSSVSTTPSTSTSSSSSSSSSASGIEIKVDYAGSWSGNYGDESGSQSVDGSGTKTFKISGSPSVVSAVFQKRDGGSGTLTVSILQNGNTVETKSTSAQYGVATASHSFL